MEKETPSKGTIDRRMFPRVLDELPVFFGLLDMQNWAESTEELQRGTMCDVSGGGIALTTKTRLDRGRFVDLEIRLPAPFGTVVCVGRVIWCRGRAKGDRFDAGIEFWWSGNGDGISQRLLGQFVLERLEQRHDDLQTEPKSETHRLPSRSEPVRRFRALTDYLISLLHRRRALTCLRGGRPAGIQEWNRWRDALETAPRLAGIDLGGADLSGADLRASDLRDANLDGCDLRFTHLDDADFRGCRLRGANFDSAMLSRIGFRGVDLEAASFRGCNLGEADLREANLGGTDLREAYLIEANLRSANLSQADLRGSVLVGANLRNTDLRAADLRHANFDGAQLNGAILYGANLEEAELTRADLDAADLRGANLLAARLPAGFSLSPQPEEADACASSR